MNSDRVLWQGKSSGIKSPLILMVDLLFLLGSILGTIIGGSRKDASETLLIIATICIIAAIFISVSSIIIIRRTDLKWDVSSLIFTATENGIYFTGKGNQASFFYAEWSEITGYKITSGRNGKSNVIVNFDAPSDAGVMGKIKYMKMVGIAGADELCEIFRQYGIKEEAQVETNEK